MVPRVLALAPQQHAAAGAGALWLETLPCAEVPPTTVPAPEEEALASAPAACPDGQRRMLDLCGCDDDLGRCRRVDVIEKAKPGMATARWLVGDGRARRAVVMLEEEPPKARGADSWWAEAAKVAQPTPAAALAPAERHASAALLAAAPCRPEQWWNVKGVTDSMLTEAPAGIADRASVAKAQTGAKPQVALPNAL